MDDTLPGDLVVAAARHVAECPACARHDTAVRRSLLLARNLARDAAPLECSADFAARLEARLAAVRAECQAARTGAAATGGPARVAPDDWTPSWWELASMRVPARLRTRPTIAAAAALLALTAGATFHSAQQDELQFDGATAAAMTPFGSPFTPPPAPLAVAVEEPMFEPASGSDDVLTWVTYDGGNAGAVDAGALVAPAATGVPVWAAAMLAGEAPAALWRGTAARTVGRRAAVDMPAVQLISDVREAR